MAKAPRFIADTRAGANIGAFQTPGGADVGASLAGLGGNVSDAGFDQLTRQAVSEAQIEGRKAGEEGGLTGQEPTPVAGTIAGQAYNAAARNSFVRAQSRKETIDTIRSTSAFSLAAEQERERMMDEGDVTDPAAAEQYAQFLANQQNELLSTSTMSDFGKQRLQAQLEAYKMDFSGRFGKRVSEAQSQLVGRSASKAIQAVTARTMRDPSDIIGRFRELDDSLDVLAPGMTPDEELAYRDNGRQHIIKASVSRLLAGGDVRGARALIDDTPGLMEQMDPAEQNVILGGIVAAEKALAAAKGSKKPMFQDMPVEGGKIQRVVSYDNGASFRPFGVAYDRREPFIIQEVIGDDGTVRQVAVPRAAISSASGQASGGQFPGPGGPDESGGPGVEGLPPGSVVLSEAKQPATPDQSKAQGFAQRMIVSNEILDRFESEGLDLGGMAAEGAGVLGNFLKSGDRQKYEQSRRDFINAQLRRESGLNISPTEFENANQQYFPQPGDGIEIIEQKRKARELAISSMMESTSAGFKAERKKPGIAAAAASSRKEPSGGAPSQKRVKIDLSGNVIEGP